MTVLMLLMRQKSYNSDPKNSGFTLSEQEHLDKVKDVPWEELVRRNREMIAKQLTM